MTTPLDLANLTDAELTAHARAGDNGAMGELYAKHHAPAVSYLRASWPECDAEAGVCAVFFAYLDLLAAGKGLCGCHFEAQLYAGLRYWAERVAVEG